MDKKTPYMKRIFVLIMLLAGMSPAIYAQKKVVKRQSTTRRVAPAPVKSQAATSYSAAQKRVAEEILANMVYVEGGSFTNYLVRHTVSGFRINRYEVTQKEWKTIMGNNPSAFKGDNLPVEQVSWRDVEKFLNRLNAISGHHFRLPTEAEWEFAARGGNQSQGLLYAGSPTPAPVAWYGLNSGDCTHPVGRKKPNELGLYDMSGNVAEWCHDWWGNDYNTSDTPGKSYVNYQGCPVNYQGRILRGGAFNDSNVNYLQCGIRQNANHNTRADWLGFRLAM